MPEMTAKEYLETKARMTDECGIFCEDCPMSIHDDGCIVLEYKSPEKAIEIVRKWGEEHPKVTILDKLKEVFPDFRIGDLCPSSFGYENLGECCDGLTCHKCWNQPYKET